MNIHHINEHYFSSDDETNITGETSMQIDSKQARKKKQPTPERCDEPGCERPPDRYNMGSFYAFFCEFHAGYNALWLQRRGWIPGERP